MTTQEYRQMLETMRKELAGLLELQEDTEQKIAQLKQAIVAMAPLATEPDEKLHALSDWMVTPGITEGIRQILRAAHPKRLTPVEIKDQLKNSGVNLYGQKNVMASVHSALKRLLDGDELTTSDEGLTYGWKRKSLNVFAAEATPPPPPPPMGGLARYVDEITKLKK